MTGIRSRSEKDQRNAGHTQEGHFEDAPSDFPWALRRRKKSGASRKDSLSFFAITSRSVHSVQRPDNINNLYPIVTSRRESKRANAHRDWSHLALRKPATSRLVDGRYAGHRFSSAMHGRRIIFRRYTPPRKIACENKRRLFRFICSSTLLHPSFCMQATEDAE